MNERETPHNKLVRGKIPGIICSNGEEPVTRVLGDEEYLVELLNKIVEEAIEVRDSGGSPEEFADLEEVVTAYLEARGISSEDVERIRLQKRTERGGFEEKAYLIKTIKK